jgi:hypothetical protein
VLLEHLRCQTRLFSDHYTNYLNLSGRLPEEKHRLLVEIDRAMDWEPGRFRSFYVGTH